MNKKMIYWWQSLTHRHLRTIILFNVLYWLNSLIWQIIFQWCYFWLFYHSCVFMATITVQPLKVDAGWVCFARHAVSIESNTLETNERGVLNLSQSQYLQGWRSLWCIGLTLPNPSCDRGWCVCDGSLSTFCCWKCW